MSDQTSDDAERGRLEFRIGDVFPANDPVSRLVMRLSMALGDLRVALEYAVRDEQPPHERLHFVHLAAMHLRELLPLLDPRAGSTLPDLEAFLAATQPPAEDAERLRAAHARVLELLTEPFQQRPTVKLRGELRRLRNGFAHYHRDARSEAALTAAMERAADVESRYVIRTRTMRADYADDVAANLVHPFDGAEADACARDSTAV